MIWTGTSGFQYPEWKGSFYPRDLSAARMLPFYAERFSTTEINYSFYRVPTPKALTTWSTSTPKNFRFSFKAPKEITHIRRLRGADQALGRFVEAIGAMNKKLGVVLFQLPPFLKKDLPLLEEFLASLPRSLKSTFEFRHPSWFDDETFAALKAKNVALCVAESEKLSAPVVFTADYGYFRLRREDYTKKDIARWAGVIGKQRKHLKDTYIYFMHEETGAGPKFAKQLMGLIKQNPK